MKTIAIAIALAVGLSGCQLNPLTVCSADLSVTLTPRERTLSVGESFAPEAAFFGCGGTKRLQDTITWAAADPAVVSVDPTTGRTTALAAGQTSVLPTGARYGHIASILVTVK